MLGGNTIHFRVFIDGTYRETITLGIVLDGAVLLMSVEEVEEFGRGGQKVVCVAQMCSNPSRTRPGFAIVISGAIGEVEFASFDKGAVCARNISGLKAEVRDDRLRP